MSNRYSLSGNEAAATAIRQINPDVVAAFPITPSTEIPQYLAQFKANGQIDTELILVESEHSAISACLAAQAAGVRAMTATSSAGFALMHEVLYVVSSDRLPVVMAVVNRALTGPININNDHSDSMGSRDCCWLQLYSENAQEAYDNLIMAHRIAEHPKVRLPIMVCQDGFITSHAVENLVLEDDELVQSFVGEYAPEKSLLNPKEALSVGAYGISAYYFEFKRQQAEAMRAAKRVILEVSSQFEQLCGRSYGLIEQYRMEDAAYAVVVMGSSAGTGKAAVDILRNRGKKAGLIKVRSFRPFPGEELAAALKNVKAIGIMDKSDSFSDNGGPLGVDTRSALYVNGVSASAANFIYGLGGRDVRLDDFYTLFDKLESYGAGARPEAYSYIGVRE